MRSVAVAVVAIKQLEQAPAATLELIERRGPPLTPPCLTRVTPKGRAARALDRRPSTTNLIAGAWRYGMTLKQGGELAGAQAAFCRADQRGDKSGSVSLGNLLVQHGDLAAAESAYRRRAADRGHPMGAKNLAVLLEKRGDYKGALAALERAANSLVVNSSCHAPGTASRACCMRYDIAWLPFCPAPCRSRSASCVPFSRTWGTSCLL